MSDDDNFELPTPPAHFFTDRDRDDNVDGGAVAGPGPSTAEHRAGAFRLEEDVPAPPKKRGRPKGKQRAREVDEEDVAPPAKRARIAAGSARGYRATEQKDKAATEEYEYDDEDGSDVDEYREDFGSEDNSQEDSLDEDDATDTSTGGTSRVSKGKRWATVRTGKGKARPRGSDDEDTGTGSDTSNATSRTSSHGGTSRRERSAGTVLDRGGVKLKSTLGKLVPPPVPRLFRKYDLEALLEQVGDVDNSEGLGALPDELRESLEGAMDPELAQDVLEMLEKQLALYDRAYATLNAELAKAQVEESVLANVKLIASNKRDEIRRAQKAGRSFTPT